MSPPSRRLAFGLLATLAVVAAWLGMVLARWDEAERAAFAVLVVLLVVTGYLARFSRSLECRDWWYGFALFGLFHLLSPASGERQSLACTIADRLSDQVLGPFDAIGNPELDENQFPRKLTPLGIQLAGLPILRNGSPVRANLPYAKSVTKHFATLLVAWIGGWVAVYLGWNRRPDDPSSDDRRRVPRLGLAALLWIALLAGVTFVIDSRPVYYMPGWFPIVPGCEAGHFALYQVECVLVLFAALEARFGDRSTRVWWLGFVLFGGFYLLTLKTTLHELSPASWLTTWHEALLERYVATRSSTIVQVHGLILMDYETQTFLQMGYSWAPLLGFLPAAWIGTGVARGAALLGRDETRCFTIRRLMIAIGALGLLLATARGTSTPWLTLVAESLTLLFAFAALWAAIGTGRNRAWWSGFALVGGVDFVLWATRAGMSPFMLISSTPWPTHRLIEGLFRLGYERSIGQVVQTVSLFGSPNPKQQAIFDRYEHGRTILLMLASLPMGWLGATIARRIERRRDRDTRGSSSSSSLNLDLQSGQDAPGTLGARTT